MKTSLNGMIDPQEAAQQDEPAPRGFDQKWLGLIALAIAGLVLLAAILTGQTDLTILANKLLNLALVLVAAWLFNEFYLTRRTNVDAQILSHPVATAIYAGAVVLACGIALTV